MLEFIWNPKAIYLKHLIHKSTSQPAFSTPLQFYTQVLYPVLYPSSQSSPRKAIHKSVSGQIAQDDSHKSAKLPVEASLTNEKNIVPTSNMGHMNTNPPSNKTTHVFNPCGNLKSFCDLRVLKMGETELSLPAHPNLHHPV